MRLIIISGATATGKTGIAKKVAKSLKYPLYSKDAIKEELFDADTPKHNYFWYEKQGRDRFYGAIEKSITGGESIVIENNFMKPDSRRLQAIMNKNVQAVEVYCYARGMTRLRRFIRRGEGESRHKMHRDRRWYPSVLLGCLLGYVGINWLYAPVGLSERLLKLDTTDFSRVSTKAILDFIK